MGPESRHNSNASDAFQILHTSIHSNTEAPATLQQYISHLEELLLAELGAEEFTRRLGSLQIRDAESLFIPDHSANSRKRSISTSTENGSSPKKARSDSSASSLSVSSHLGKIAKSTQSNSSTSDTSPRTSRKSSVSALSVADDQQTIAQRISLRSLHPRPQSRRGSQSVMLPNVQPSSNFHSRASFTLTTNPSQDLLAVQCLQKQSSAMSERSDEVLKKASTKPMSSLHHAASHRTSVQSSSKHATPTLSRKPAFPSVGSSSCSSANKQLSLVKDVSPSSNKFLSSASKPSTSASKSSSFSNSSSGESSSVTRKPWRASKKG